MSNLTVSLSGIITVVDLGLSPTQTIIARQLNNPSLNLTAGYFDPYFQTSNGTSTINLPAATVWFAYVRNLSNTGSITVNFTPTGGSSQTLVLVQGTSGDDGGIFLYLQPSEGAGGITAMSLTATAVLPACVLVGA